MKRYFRCICVITLLIATGLLSGCAAPVFKARVTTFQNWASGEESALPLSYAFSHTTGQEVSLEQTAYEDLVRPALEAIGFTETPTGIQARYLISVYTGAVEKEELISTPVYSQPPSPVLMPGYYNRHTGERYGSQWVYPYGMGPQYIGNQVSTLNYLHARLTITMRDTQSLNEQSQPRSVYETTAITKSANHSLLRLIPLLAQAALSDFPADNGNERIVSIELEAPR